MLSATSRRSLSSCSRSSAGREQREQRQAKLQYASSAALEGAGPELGGAPHGAGALGPGEVGQGELLALGHGPHRRHHLLHPAAEHAVRSAVVVHTGQDQEQAEVVGTNADTVVGHDPEDHKYDLPTLQIRFLIHTNTISKTIWRHLRMFGPLDWWDESCISSSFWLSDSSDT